MTLSGPDARAVLLAMATYAQQTRSGQHAPVATLAGYWDRDLRNRMANDAFLAQFGRTADEVHGIHVRDLLGGPLYARNEPHMLRALAGEPQLFDREMNAPSGGVSHTQVSYIPHVEDGEVHGFFAIATDITAQRVAERRVQAAERRFRALFENAPVATFLVAPDGVIHDVNPAGVELLGRSHDEMVGMHGIEMTHPGDVDSSEDQLRDLLAATISAYTVDKRYVHADGHTIWAQLSACLLPSVDDEPQLVLGQIQDISDRHRRQANLERIAQHDPLTELVNRRGLLAALTRECERGRRHGGSTALLLLDLNHFKAVNDALGHAAGDQVLASVAGLLRTRVRGSDLAARYGGDEFAVLLTETSLSEAEGFARDLDDLLLCAALGLAGTSVSAAIGITMLEPTDDADSALARADHAMYAVKRARVS